MILTAACQWHLYYAGMHGGPVGVSVHFRLFPRLWPGNFSGSDSSEQWFQSPPLLHCTSARFSKMQMQRSVWQFCLCSPNTCIWKGNSLCLVLKLPMILQWCYREKLVLSTTERERDECFNQKNKEKLHVFISNRVNGENLLFFN